MAISLKKALSAYDRIDTAKVDCGNGWFYEIKPFSAVTKIFSKEQARIRTMGVAKKKVGKTNSAAITGVDAPEKENEYMLGTYEADVAFFIEHMSVGWEGLQDDNGAEVLYSAENAEEVFTKNGTVGEQLFKELFLAAMDTALFVRGTEDNPEVIVDADAPAQIVPATAEGDAKN